MNKITKIIYIVGSPFSQRDYKRLGVEVFLENRFQAFIYDFTPFLRPQADALGINDPSNYKGITKFKRRGDAIAAINKLGKDCFIIILLAHTVETFGVYKALSRHDVPYAVYSAAAIPRPSKQINVKDKVKKILSLTPRRFITYILYFLFTRIFFRFLKINSARFLLAGGAKTPKGPTVNHKTKMLWIHTLDYDIYLAEKNGGKLTEEAAVFLDEDYVFHSDYTSLKFPPPTSAEEYYPYLCNFFDYIETKLDLEVVIAAHPRSHYEELPDYFQGRKVIQGKTSELVKNAKLVILQDSTSINFPVLYKKPMIFVTTDSIEKTIYGESISKFASYFKKKPINISRKVNLDLEDDLLIYEEGYARYKNDFIKIEGTEELPFWQVVSNEIKGLNV